MNYRKWLLEDLENLERRRFSITQMESELETIDAEYAAIKATNYDKVIVQSSGNAQEEKLLTAIAKKEELQANLKATRMFVEDMDRLLGQLTDEENQVIYHMCILREKNAVTRLCEDLNYEKTRIYGIRNEALTHLAHLRFGKGYQI